MALVKIIKRHSTKSYKKKTPTASETGTSTASSGNQPLNKKQPLDPLRNGRRMYTYILKDLVRSIYKIGKTTNPNARFKSLCVRGRVVPIALVCKDIENMLHTKYAENRIVNTDYIHNGSTEWFKMGGSFDVFICALDKGQILPYITVHTMVMELIEHNVIKISDSSTEWELTQSKFGYFLLGVEILLMLGYVKKEAGKLITEDSKNILLVGKKLSISEEVIELLKSKYSFFISTTLRTDFIKENKNKESRLRKVDLRSREFDSEVFLLLNKVL